MTNKYYKTAGAVAELTSDELKGIFDKCNGDIAKVDLETHRIRRQRIEAVISVSTAFCSLTDKPCLHPDWWCSQCPIETCGSSYEEELYQKAIKK